MNKIHSCFFIIIGLGLVNGMRADKKTTSGLAHEHLRYETVTTTKVLEDKETKEKVTVTITVKHNDAASADRFCPFYYVVKIKQTTPHPANYSLLTLGVQSIEHDVLVHYPTPAGIGFAAPGDSAATRVPTATAKLLVGRTGLKTDVVNPRLQSVNGDAVWFVAVNNASGEAEFKVEPANRRRHLGVTAWSSGEVSEDYQESHDNTPPGNGPN
jgi:hypothetical protein